LFLKTEIVPTFQDDLFEVFARADSFEMKFVPALAAIEIRDS